MDTNQFGDNGKVLYFSHFCVFIFSVKHLQWSYSSLQVLMLPWMFKLCTEHKSGIFRRFNRDQCGTVVAWWSRFLLVFFRWQRFFGITACLLMHYTSEEKINSDNLEKKTRWKILWLKAAPQDGHESEVHFQNMKVCKHNADVKAMRTTKREKIHVNHQEMNPEHDGRWPSHPH